MIVHKERAAILLFVAAILVVGVLALGGCQSADETTTTSASSTTLTGETTTTAGTGVTTTTAGTGSTGTTAPGSTPTTGGPESVAQVSEQFKVCTDCHSNFNAFLVGQKVLTNNFSHAVHLNKGIKCEDCHIVPTHQPDTIAKPSMQKCFECHSQEAGAKAPGACSVCHPSDFPLVPANHSVAGWLPPANATGVKTVTAKHSDAAQKDVAYCQMCHADSFCLSCHKTPMPHASDWVQTHPQTVAKAGEASCAQCHPDKWLCNDCHHKGYKNDGTGWTAQHPPIVKTGGTDACFECHNPLTCAHCHITGKLDMTLKPSGG
jgi:hypothetical protein